MLLDYFFMKPGDILEKKPTNPFIIKLETDAILVQRDKVLGMPGS
jgi:hypothetical protein